MPKDLKDEKEKSKKKMVVVEEVINEKEQEVSEVSKVPEVAEVPVITETKTEDIEKAINSEPKSGSDTSSEFIEKTNYLWIIIPTALLIGALVGGLITYFSGLSRMSETNATPSPIATVTPEVQVTVTPSPKSSFDRSAVKLQVLNGSGVSGLAGKAKIYLEGLGYKDVVAGNASASNLVETTVSVKDIQKELLESVVTDLSKNYKVAEKTEILSASSKYDFVITLGSK